MVYLTDLVWDLTEALFPCVGAGGRNCPYEWVFYITEIVLWPFYALGMVFGPILGFPY